MPGFEPFDVVAVPFPYVERPVTKRRPALVISSNALEKEHGLLWVAMITSAQNQAWTHDIAINDLEAAGLPHPSVVRTAKIACIDATTARRLGQLDPESRSLVQQAISTYWAISN